MSSKREKERARKLADRLRREAEEAQRAGDYALAKKIIARAILEGPGNARYWKEQGEILAALEDWPGAEQSWRQAHLLAPDYAAILPQLAAACARRGDLQGELEWLERWRELDPGAPAADRVAQLRANGLRLASEREPPEEYQAQLGAPHVHTAHWPWEAIAHALFQDGLARVADALTATQAESVLAYLGESWQSATQAQSAASAPAWLAPWTAELCAGLAQAAACGRFQATHEVVPAKDYLPLERREPTFLRLCAAETLNLPPPSRRPRFPYALHLLLDGAGTEPVLCCNVRDQRPGKKTVQRGARAEPRDLLIACRRERWVRVGKSYGLQPVVLQLCATAGWLRVLSL